MERQVEESVMGKYKEKNIAEGSIDCNGGREERERERQVYRGRERKAVMKTRRRIEQQDAMKDSWSSVGRRGETIIILNNIPGGRLLQYSRRCEVSTDWPVYSFRRVYRSLEEVTEEEKEREEEGEVRQVEGMGKRGKGSCWGIGEWRTG